MVIENSEVAQQRTAQCHRAMNGSSTTRQDFLDARLMESARMRTVRPARKNAVDIQHKALMLTIVEN
jgi:hypothetical protein